MRRFSTRLVAGIVVAACSLFVTVPAGAQESDPAVVAYLQAMWEVRNTYDAGPDWQAQLDTIYNAQKSRFGL